MQAFGHFQGGNPRQEVPRSRAQLAHSELSRVVVKGEGGWQWGGALADIVRAATVLLPVSLRVHVPFPAAPPLRPCLSPPLHHKGSTYAALEVSTGADLLERDPGESRGGSRVGIHSPASMNRWIQHMNCLSISRLF